MWAGLLRYAIAELIRQLVPAFIKAFRDWREDVKREADARKRAKENTRRADEYKDSSVGDSTDDFGGMP